ncbi:MAG: CheY-like chemotaxis protein [Ascidiaceihabitans sp.]|jgi:CheY-like chemotaxis protein
MRNETTSFLFVDDDAVSIAKFKRFMTEAGINNPLFTASDGVQALEILRGQGGHEKLQQPYLVILDLSMPRMDGFEFLDVVRADPDLKDIIIYMMTTSENQADIESALERGADGYFPKDQAKVGFQQVTLAGKALSDPDGVQHVSL